jgi:hypothetical protein
MIKRERAAVVAQLEAISEHLPQTAVCTGSKVAHYNTA